MLAVNRCILPSRMDSSCAMNYCYSLFAYIIVYYCGSNHTELMTAYGLILALVLPCCSSMLCSVAQADLIGSNHTELMRACGLILALVVLCYSSRFGNLEPHRPDATLFL